MREKGSASFSANFEAQKAAPIDARMLVDTKADLILTATWTANDGFIYAYEGMIVSVHADSTPANNGLYRLKTLPYTSTSNWEQLGTGSGDSTKVSKAVNQTAHGFNNDFIYNNGTVWTKSIAASGGVEAATHFAQRVDNDNFNLISIGEVDVSTMVDETSGAMVAGNYYFLSQHVYGKTTTTMPASGLVQDLLKVNAINQATVLIGEPYITGGGSGGGGGGGGSQSLDQILYWGNNAGAYQIDMNGNRVVNSSTPLASGDLATKGYVDLNGGGDLTLTLGKGNSAGTYQIDMNGNRIVSAGTPLLDNDVATKAYVDTHTFSGSSFKNSFIVQVKEFVNADLTAGKITVLHNTNNENIIIQLYANTDKIVVPDNVIINDLNSFTIDITSFGTIAGTWRILYTAKVTTIDNASQLYNYAFTDTNLVSGMLTVVHGLDNKYSIIQVYDDSNNQILPDDITLIDNNSFVIDLTLLSPITGTWEVIYTNPISTSSSFYQNSFVGDGSNTIFTLTYNPLQNSENVYINGLRQRKIIHYTVNGDQITTTTPPASGALIDVEYNYNIGATFVDRDDIGTVKIWAGTTPPTNWMLCDGSTLDRANYSALFSVIGVTYGPGDGLYTYNVPDARGIFIRGAGTNSMLTASNSDPLTAILGTYQNDAFQSHKHSMEYGTMSPYFWAGSTGTWYIQGGSNGYAYGNNQMTPGGPTTYPGSGAPRTDIETRPANLAMNYIIKYK